MKILTGRRNAWRNRFGRYLLWTLYSSVRIALRLFVSLLITCFRSCLRMVKTQSAQRAAPSAGVTFPTMQRRVRAHLAPGLRVPSMQREPRSEPAFTVLKTTQQLHMSRENQRMIKDTLRDLRHQEELVYRRTYQMAGEDTDSDASLDDSAAGDAAVPWRRPSERDAGYTRYSDTEVDRHNQSIKDDFRRIQDSKSYQRMVEQRHRLPAWDMQKKILRVLRDNQVMVISGETGCGKTTQVPQFILEQYLGSSDHRMCNVVCTQPRRISATSVAARVAQERAVQLGTLVGYQIRLESKQSPRTRLLFCTTGIILRRLEGDPLLEGITHIIVDEVHERSEDSDFLLLILRRTVRLRPDLKVILMSATMNAELFSDYFGGCPILEIPGRTFDVKQFFLEDAVELTGYTIESSSPYYDRSGKRTSAGHLGGLGQSRRLPMGGASQGRGRGPGDRMAELNFSALHCCRQEIPRVSRSTNNTLGKMDFEKINYDLIVELVRWIVEGRHQYPKEGAILVFLPGYAEIQALYDQLNSHAFFQSRSRERFKIIPLHSTLSSEEQQSVFETPEEGERKIVISTNIAETSITIDDVVFVIDCGKMKEKRFDAAKSMESLDTVWVSRANAQQRKGRAGRVAPGVCFHLFTRHQYHDHLADQPIPEVQRVPLEKLILNIKMLDIFRQDSVEEVVERLLEPPKLEAVVSALQRLQDIGALDDDQELTSLGYHLGSLPVDVRVGKLMLFGAIFRCLDSVLTIAAALSFKSPFVAPFDKREEANKKRREFAVNNSDHLTMLNAYNQYMDSKQTGHQASYRFCKDNFLSIKTLQMLSSLKQQYVELLSDIGFVREGLRLRNVERASWDDKRDGVIAATGNEANENSTNLELVSAILVGALYPNVVRVVTTETWFNMVLSVTGFDPPRLGETKFVTKKDGWVYIHPTSVNFKESNFASPFFVYHEKVKTSRVFIRDCTMVSPYPLLLFGGGSISMTSDIGGYVLTLDGWIGFQMSSRREGELVLNLRRVLNELLTDKINSPHMDLAVCPRGSRIIATIVDLITTQ